MSFEEMVVALVALIGGITLTGFIFIQIFGLVKSWINRKNTGYSEEDFNRLARAFTQHKKEMERRIQNLEAIVADTEDLEKAEPTKQIELQKDEGEQSSSSESGQRNLKNMLRS